jgi:hypothetical protein
MEIDVVKHTKQRNKRRERAQRMQAERDKDADGVGIDGDSADEDSKPIRQPQRRKKANLFKEPSPILEEDVVDGFAILSFKTYEDLEVRKRKIITSVSTLFTPPPPLELRVMCKRELNAVKMRRKNFSTPHPPIL